jgi:predicted Fe-Mo cluster-binding NifX family protein
MKTIITSAGNTIESSFDKRFGRAAWFCLLDEETGEATFHENQNSNAMSGAGTKASEKAVELGAGKIISGDFGPKAKNLLEKFSIQMVIFEEEDLSVKDIIDRIK